MTPEFDSASIADLVRAGRVRFGLFPSFFYSRHPTSGEFYGFGIKLARAFAARVPAELTLLEYQAPPIVVASLKSGACDVAFLGIDPKRAIEVDFTPPYMKTDFTFLVPAASAAFSIADVDRPGQRVGVVRNHAMDAALRGKLASAEHVYAETPDQAFALFKAGRVDAMAGIRPGLLKFAEGSRDVRVLEGGYGENRLAMAVAKGQPARLDYVSAFIRDAQSSGLLQRTIEHTGLAGVELLALDGSQ